MAAPKVGGPVRPNTSNMPKAGPVSKNVINIIKSFYDDDDSRCSVRVNGVLSEWFQVWPGVSQGWFLSPPIFGHGLGYEIGS